MFFPLHPAIVVPIWRAASPSGSGRASLWCGRGRPGGDVRYGGGDLLPGPVPVVFLLMTVHLSIWSPASRMPCSRYRAGSRVAYTTVIMFIPTRWGR